MDDLQHVGYSREVIEFVTVAKEFCNYLENLDEVETSTFLSKMQKFIPLIYLKGSLLPSCEIDSLGWAEDHVTEEDYNQLHSTLKSLLGDYTLSRRASSATPASFQCGGKDSGIFDTSTLLRRIFFWKAGIFYGHEAWYGADHYPNEKVPVSQQFLDIP